MKRWVLAAIRFYQAHISSRTQAHCRFYPTCSCYAYQAISRYGVVRGGAMAAWRLLRCNPLFPGGADPVPERTACKPLRGRLSKSKIRRFAGFPAPHDHKSNRPPYEN